MFAESMIIAKRLDFKSFNSITLVSQTHRSEFAAELRSQACWGRDGTRGLSCCQSLNTERSTGAVDIVESHASGIDVLGRPRS